jgi:hypothetical protein
MSNLLELYRAIKFARPRPKCIAVSAEMWETLKKAGVIQMKTGHAWSLFKDSQRFPTIHGDIPVIVNPALDLEKKPFVLSDTGEEAPAAPEGEPQPLRRLTERQRVDDAA